MSLSDLRLGFHACWLRLREAVLVLKGGLPARLTPVDALVEARAGLAAAQAESGKLAAALADARVAAGPMAAELTAAREDLQRCAEELAAARAEVKSLAGAIARQAAPAARINGALHVMMPAEILRPAAADGFKVVDVGAQLLESADHVYTSLAQAMSAQIVGFEPLSGKRQKRVEKESSVVMLPHAIGQGGSAVLRVTKFNPASSLLAPDAAKLAEFLALPDMLEVVEEIGLETRRLDDIPEAAGCRLLKIDVQGGELDVLRGATGTLKEVLAVFIEVEFLDIYRGQPLFCSVHAFLEEQGFELLDLLEPGYGSYRAADNGQLQSRLLWADGLYVRKLGPGCALPPPRLLQLACAAHFLAKKFDYAAHVLAFSDRLHGTRYAEAYNQKVNEAVNRLDATVRKVPSSGPGFR